MSIDISGIAKAITKVVAGDEGAQKFSRMMQGLTDAGTINGTAAKVSGAQLAADYAINAASKNKDNAKLVAGALGLGTNEPKNYTSQKIAEKIAEKRKSSDGLDDLVKLKDLNFDISQKTKDAFNEKMSHYSGALGGSSEELAGLLGREGKKSGGLTALYRGVFKDPDVGNARKIAAVGAYGAGALGLRVLQGGDLTHNARGENDIAGIPFF